jgi:hypothetical protein
MPLPLGLKVLVLSLLLASPVTDLLAQGSPWGIGLEVGLTRFWGGSEPVAPNDAPGLKPYRPTTVGLRIDRSFRRYRLGLGVQYAASAIGQDGREVAILLKGQMTWVQVTPEIAYQLAVLGPLAELRAFAGPVFDLWLPSGDDSRVRAGARGGLELLVPLGSGLAGMLRAHGGVTGSLFNDTEVPSEFQTGAMPNAGLALGLRLGF